MTTPDALPPAVLADARALARLAATNPFSDAWTREADDVQALEARTAALVRALHRAVARGGASDEVCALYRELALFDLYNRFTGALDELVTQGARKKVGAWRAFSAAFSDAFAVDVRARPSFGAAHLFAGCFQLRRAFFHTSRFIVGASASAARLRAAVWEAVFTADAARYRRALVDRMKDVPTLVLGPTGTGKELVARAIGLSGFVPFIEERQTFAGDQGEGFFALHLQALSPTLVESELFGHKKGAFTGALEDRAGIFAACPPWGAVFFDEVGELDASLQTKLLRVLEGRDFTPLGQNHSARFVGRVIAATNRDLLHEVEAGRFRRDLYFRLAGVVVQTPSLKARIDDHAGELLQLARTLAEQIAGADEAPALVRDVERVLLRAPVGYAWPGNVRELAQCVRTVLVRGDFTFSQPDAHPSRMDWLEDARAGRLTADALVTQYVRHVHAQVGTFEGTARKIGLDRRTVRARVDATEVEPANG